MNDFYYDHFANQHDSDEDTEDASETGSIIDDQEKFDSNYEIKEQIFQVKFDELKKQLLDLDNEEHLEYIDGLKSIEEELNDRRLYFDCAIDLEHKIIDREYKLEISAAIQEYNEKEKDVKQSLITELEEKRKSLETEITIEDNNSEPKTLTTRKLRRRPNEPIPLPDKRRRITPGQLNLTLDSDAIRNDVNRILQLKSKHSSVKIKNK